MNIIVGDKKHEVEIDSHSIKVDGQVIEWAISSLGDGTYHIIQDNQNFNIQLVENPADPKSLTLYINGKKSEVVIKDNLDLMLEKLGLDQLAGDEISDIKAPMPGLILELNVEEGQEIKKGDAVLVLEAMKMENIIKSPGEGTISKIKCKKGDSVEKNQVLLEF